MRIIIIGGGWAGCAAAISAKKAGAEVHIYEKTDLLLGLGNVGGIMRNNGRYTASEELIALGGGDLINITDANSRHKGIDFPGDSFVDGDIFIETTGTTGPMGNCLRYGNGCSMCILRCPSFGPRISISERCGVPDIQGERAEDALGAMSGSCKLAKESLSDEINKVLNEKGVVVLKVPTEDVNYGKLDTKVCQQYALKEFAENVVLLDTGHAKLMTTYYPLEKLRKIPGLEHAKYVDPYAGSKGNSMRYLSVAPRTNDMKVQGVDNLFCAGEKSGLFVGHTEAICTGTLAGHNSVRLALGLPLLILPSSIAIGDIISYENEQSKTRDGRKVRYTFAGAGYFKRMQELGLYTLNIKEIKNKVTKLNLDNIFNTKLC